MFSRISASLGVMMACCARPVTHSPIRIAPNSSFRSVITNCSLSIQRKKTKPQELRPIDWPRPFFSLLAMPCQYEPTRQCGEFFILSPWRSNCPTQFEHSILDYFERQAELGDSATRYLALLNIRYRQPTRHVCPPDSVPKEFPF